LNWDAFALKFLKVKVSRSLINNFKNEH